MRLDITTGKNGVLILTASDGTRKPTSLVVDPNNTTGPLPLKEWVEGSGGTAPIETGKDNPDAAPP